MGLRFNPPPGWPPVPDGFVPPPGWQPDPSWPAAPDGWQWWVPDDVPGNEAVPGYQGGPGYQGAYGDRGYGYESPRKGGTNGLAIASFVLGILGALTLTAIAGIVFGIVALVKIRNVAQKGKGFAIAGLVLSAVWLVGLVTLIAVLGATQAQRSPATGQVSKKGSVSIFALRLGDCFDNPDSSQAITSVTAIPCAQRHDTQVFAQFGASGSGYPGAASLKQQANKGCNSRIAGSVDRSKVSATMSIRFIFPEEGSWFLGQRRITCLIVAAAGSLTSSLLVAHPRG